MLDLVDVIFKLGEAAARKEEARSRWLSARSSISIVRVSRRERHTISLDVIELNEPKEADPMMLHHEMMNNDVTRHVTHGFGARTFRDREKKIGSSGMVGESACSREYKNGTANKKYYMSTIDRHSADVDDGVISSDGDYDAAGQNLDALEVADETVVPSSFGCNKDKSSDMRLSHAESTDSGMGFSDNAKEADTSRLSAGDGYGTIHLVSPIPLEEHENRKSLLDGDVEYDEVMDFISTPTEQEQSVSPDNVPTLSTFKTPKQTDEEITSPGDSASKYAELDLAKILHTKRRHKNTSTLGRRMTVEERLPDESAFNSLKRKPKSKTHSFSSYGTYGRNRKSSKAQGGEPWSSRPPSTCNDNENDTLPIRSDSIPSTSFHRQSFKANPTENTFGHYNTLNPRRLDFSSDLMMTSDVNADFMNVSATIDRATRRKSPNSPQEEADTSKVDTTDNTNRWSWLSNSSHNTQSYSIEKVPTPSKSPWKIFRRLLGGGDSKNKSVVDSTTSTPSLSTKPRSTSLFRRFSSRRSNKHNLNKRRNSVPAKSEWDVHDTGVEKSDFQVHIPVIDAGKQKPGALKSRGRLSTRLRSFRGGKNRGSKRHGSVPMSKGLSISSPQLAVNAIDPTRNYSDHQLLNLNKLSISDGRS